MPRAQNLVPNTPSSPDPTHPAASPSYSRTPPGGLDSLAAAVRRRVLDVLGTQLSEVGEAVGGISLLNPLHQLTVA